LTNIPLFYIVDFMKNIYTEKELPQRSSEWLEARKDVIGGSDVSDVLGIGFQKAWTLWKRKLGKLKPKTENEAMLRGAQFEDEALEAFLCTEEAQSYENINIKKFFAKHPDLEYVGVSFDGVDVDNKFVVELKVPSRALNFKSVFYDGMKPYYEAQVQLQLLVANALWGITKAYFVSYYPEGAYIQDNLNYMEYFKRIVVLEVEYDAEYCTHMASAIKSFHEQLTDGTWDDIKYKESIKDFEKYLEER